MQKYLSLLKTLPLFQRISDEDLSSLLTCLNATIFHHPKDSFILIEGELISGIEIICEGEVQLLKEDIMGNRSLINTLSAGDLFAESFVAAKIDRIPISVKTTMPCVILKIKYQKLITTCSSSCVFHAKMIENMLTILAQKNIDLTYKNEILSSRSIREKVLTYLSFQAKITGQKTFFIPFNRQELADYLSIERSALSRELGFMQKENLISFHKNKFTLLV